MTDLPRVIETIDQRIDRAVAPLVKRIEALEGGAPPRKWDEGEHEGCGIDSQRALEREKAERAAQPQSPRTAGKAFHQIAHDEGKPDLAALWQAVVDNTKGSGFWLGELLLTTIEKETGFNGSAHTRPDRKFK